MQKHKVTNTGEALAYITDCMLATVCHLATNKSTRKSNELKRQISIAQYAIDWMKDFGVDFSSTRAKEVERIGSVQEWAEQFMV